jgi:hypothetical protein
MTYLAYTRRVALEIIRSGVPYTARRAIILSYLRIRKKR